MQNKLVSAFLHSDWKSRVLHWVTVNRQKKPNQDCWHMIKTWRWQQPCSCGSGGSGGDNGGINSIILIQSIRGKVAWVGRAKRGRGGGGISDTTPAMNKTRSQLSSDEEVAGCAQLTQWLVRIPIFEDSVIAHFVACQLKWHVLETCDLFWTSSFKYRVHLPQILARQQLTPQQEACISIL